MTPSPARATAAVAAAQRSAPKPAPAPAANQSPVPAPAATPAPALKEAPAAIHPAPPPGPTRALAAFAAGLAAEALDEAARHAVRRHVLDTLGSCLAGSAQRVSRIAEETVAAHQPPGSVPVPGSRRRFDPLTAAYLAGTAGHGLDVDDGYRPGSVHPGAVVVPAVLALGHARGASGARAVAAIAAGYEVACRTAEAVNPRARWRGFHNTGTCGALGAAAAAGVLIGLDAGAIEQAMGLAASGAAGLFTFLHGAGDAKRLHAGQAARSGMLAALLAERGMQGCAGVLEVRDGFFHAFGAADAEPEPYAGLDIFFGSGNGGGGALAVTGCYVKPHLCCRHIHPAIDGLLDILKAEGLAEAAVERVEVGTYRVAESHAAVAWDNFATAQMSFPFVIATALRFGAVALPHFSEAALRDPVTARAAARVAVWVDPDCDQAYPRLRSAKVRVVARDGREFARRVDEPLGGPANPIADEALIAKFHGLADPVLGPERAARVEALAWRIGELRSVAELVEALAP